MTRARDVADTQDNVGGSVAPFVAGKNKILNSDFSIWQRGTSFSVTGATTYTADRFINYYNSSPTITVSRQNFTPGELSVATSPFYYRFAQTTAGSGMTYSSICAQFVEDVRTLQGTVTLSFYAKSSISTTQLAVGVFQVFGTGGSSTNFKYGSSNIAISTSWQRYSITLTLDSLAGKTIGANSCLQPSIEFAASSRNVIQTVDIWGLQLESGNVATPFTTATGNPASELAACQRYYCRFDAGSTNYTPLTSIGIATATTTINNTFQFPVTMRVAPTSIDGLNLSVYGGGNNANPGFLSVSAVALTRASTNIAEVSSTVSGATLGGCYRLQPNNAAGYIAFGAEL